MPSKALILLGSDGQLGMHLREAFPVCMDAHDVTLHCLSRTTGGDLTDFDGLKESLMHVAESSHERLIINCAAYTAVDRAESEPERAEAVNVKGVEHLATLAEKLDIGVLHMSSDYVFDGMATEPYREGDATNPLSVYGRTKLAGEKCLLEKMKKGKGLVVRSSWLFSALGKNFLRTIYQKLTQNEPLRVVIDQYGTPTYAGHLAEALLHIAQCYFTEGEFRTPLLHYANDGGANWYELACEINRQSGLNGSIVSTTTEALALAARRPTFSPLDTSLAKKVYQMSPPTWEVGVSDALRRLCTP